MSSDDEFSFEALLGSLRDIEADLLCSRERVLPDLVCRLGALQATAVKYRDKVTIRQATVEELHGATKRIQVLAQTMLSVEEAYAGFRTNLMEDTVQALRDSEDIGRRDEVRELPEALPSYHMRKHFLETLDNPYPSQEDKEALVAITNHAATHAQAPSARRDFLEVHQLTLWFINARRRSGWSHMMRKFARNDRTRMRLLVRTRLQSPSPSIRTSSSTVQLSQPVEEVLRENLGRPLTSADKKDFEDDWTSMINWLTYGVKDKVGDWMYDLVAANKKTHRPGQARVASTAVTRSPARKPVNTPQRKARKPNQRASTTPSIESSTSFSGLESTPELSMSSTTDTSFSSIGSNLSMPHYDPFQHHDDLLQSPTLNAMGSRKVKALPKRAQQQLMPESLYTNGSGTPFTTSTRLVKPEPIRPSLHSSHTQVNSGQTNSRSSTQQKQAAFPPFDVLGQAPMPVIRRESLSSNSLSAAFG